MIKLLDCNCAQTVSMSRYGYTTPTIRHYPAGPALVCSNGMVRGLSVWDRTLLFIRVTSPVKLDKKYLDKHVKL